MIDRAYLLQTLLEFRLPVAQLRTQLMALGWDSERKLATIERRHVRAVLERYRSSNLQEADVEEWADLLEVREDLGYDPEFETPLRDAVFELANPRLTRPLSPRVASEWIDLLTSAGS